MNALKPGQFLTNRKLSTVYQIFKEPIDEISRLCQRTKPSKRDTILLKDLPTLVNQIVKQPPPQI